MLNTISQFISKDSPWNLNQADLDVLLAKFPLGIIAIDLETTGLSPLVDRIIEIGALKVTPNGIEIFETLVNPEIPIPPFTTDIHGITDEMVKNSPRIKDVLKNLNDFIGELPVVAHNAKFDLGFIVMSLHKNQFELSHSKVFCSCKLARVTHPEAENHKLKTLVELHRVPLVNHHRASDDAYASLRVFIESLRKIKAEYLEKCAMLFALNEFHPENSEELPEHLKQLDQLVQSAAVIEIKYSGGTKKNEYRPVKLTSLLNTPEGNILYAKCLLTDIYKSFKIKKITDIRYPSAQQIQEWLKRK
jgi:DNA polymerase-3 subunit epsilon